MKRTVALHINRILSVTLCIILIFITVMPVIGYAENQEPKKVRVGWYESPFNRMDKFGRRSGYAYEYQQKVASYTNWKYENVYGSWVDLMEKLKNGEIDLLSDVSYTEERTDQMLFSDLPMGTELYYAFISNDNKEITPDDYKTLNGKKVGINKDSLQEELFKEWMEKNGVEAEIIELTGSNEDSDNMLINGDIDVYITPDAFETNKNYMPIIKIGQSDYYFAVNKARPDLLKDLNYAMDKIYEENRYFNNILFEKYMVTRGTSYFLTNEEKARIADRPVKVGYQDNYMPFCSKDEESGMLTGALFDFLNNASKSFKNGEVKFEAIPYASVGEAIYALRKGEIDCVFPINMGLYDSEVYNVLVSNPVMTTEMYALFNKSDTEGITPDRTINTIIPASYSNYKIFIKDNFPNWNILESKSTENGFESVSEGTADCVLVSNYRLIELMPLIEKYKLKSYTTGETINFSFAVRQGDKHLYSILNKSSNMIPESIINSALTNYSSQNKKVTFADYLKDNWGYVVALITLVFGIILTLLIISLMHAKKANERQRLILATETDTLTKLYNKNFFFEYADKIYKENPEAEMDAIILDMDRFHYLNEFNGREFGDMLLTHIGDEIKAFVEENGGIAGRLDSDCFAIYTKSLEDYSGLLKRLQNKLKTLSHAAAIRLRMGVMPWQKDTDPSVLFNGAKSACNIARTNYASRLVVFNEDVLKREKYEQRLLNDAQKAIENGEFELYFQPQYDIRCNPPALIGAEALARWNHHELGMIMPSDFINLFERNGYISALDNYVWEGAISKIAEWKKKYKADLPVSVNISRVDILDTEFEKTFDELLKKYGIERNMLKLEVTESAYVENGDMLIDVFERLHKKGFEIELDDFGSGYSSLNMISEMPIDILKMDKEFIKNINNAHNKRLIELIINIAKSLKVLVIAEGVESESQLEFLKESGCAIAQGYYFSKAVPADDFEKIAFNA